MARGIKGHTNNPNGRPSDPNVKLLRETLRSRLVDEKRIKKLFAELDTLEGKEFVEAYLKIHKEVVPPLIAEIPEEEAQRTIVSIFESINEKLAQKKAS